MIETILHALDVYNDAAHRSLYVLSQQACRRAPYCLASIVAPRAVIWVTRTSCQYVFCTKV